MSNKNGIYASPAPPTAALKEGESDIGHHSAWLSFSHNNTHTQTHTKRHPRGYMMMVLNKASEYRL